MFKKVLKISSLSFFSVFLLSLPFIAKAVSFSTIVDTGVNPDAPYPKVFGDMSVYYETNGGISVVNTTSNQVTALRAANQVGVSGRNLYAISGTKVAYVGYSNGATSGPLVTNVVDISNLSSPNYYVCGGTNGELDVDGNKIVYAQTVGSGTLYLGDLSSPQGGCQLANGAKTITSTSATITSPKISGNYVAYIKDNEVWYADITNPSNITNHQVTTDSSNGALKYNLDIYNGDIAWTEEYQGATNDTSFDVKNYSINGTIPITFPLSVSCESIVCAPDKIDLSIDNYRIAVSDNADIITYNLLNPATTYVTTLANSYYPGGVSISGNNIVWIENGSMMGTTLPDVVGPLDHINITPTNQMNPTVPLGETLQFTAQGQDANNINIPDINYSWVGTTSDGLFIAKDKGTYPVKAFYGSIESAQVDVQVTDPAPGPLDHINISPSVTQTILSGQTIQFSAQGQDADNMNIPDLTYNWTGTDSNGLFSQTLPGHYTVKVASHWGLGGSDIESQAVTVNVVSTPDNVVKLSNSLVLSDYAPAIGEDVTDTFTLRNYGAKAITLNRVLITGRDASGSPVDYQVHDNVELTSAGEDGDRIDYSDVRKFLSTGVHAVWVCFNYQGKWYEVKPDSGKTNYMTFAVHKPNLTVSGVTFRPTTPNTNQVTLVDFSVKNNESHDVTVDVLSVGNHLTTQWYPSLDFGGYTGVLIPAGQTITRTVQRALTAPGLYVAVVSAKTGNYWSDLKWSNGVSSSSFYTVQPAPAPDSFIKLSQSLVLSDYAPAIGENVTDTFTLRNYSSNSITLNRVLITGRDASGMPVDFESHDNVFLDAYGNVKGDDIKSYSDSRIFSSPNVHAVWVCFNFQGKWYEVKPDSGKTNYMTFAVHKPNIIVTGITFNPSSPTLNQPTAVNFSVKNNETHDVTLDVLGVGNHIYSMSGPNRDYGGYTNVLIPAGQTVSYSVQRTLTEPGLYVAVVCVRTGNVWFDLKWGNGVSSMSFYTVK